MQRKIISKLSLTKQDLEYDGDLEVTGDLEISQGSLIVGGKLIISNPDAKISIYEGDLRANELYSVSKYPIFVTADNHNVLHTVTVEIARQQLLGCGI